MLAKLIVEQNLLEDVIVKGKTDLECQIELIAGDNFSEVLYRSMYKYETAPYIGPISENQTLVLAWILDKGTTVLDIGSGTGYIGEWLRMDLTACEIDPYAAYICRKRGLKVIEKSALEINQQFDIVLLLGGSIPALDINIRPKDAVYLFISKVQSLIKPCGYLLTEFSSYELPILSANHAVKTGKLRFGFGDNWTPFSFHIYPHPTFRPPFESFEDCCHAEA